MWPGPFWTASQNVCSISSFSCFLPLLSTFISCSVALCLGEIDGRVLGTPCCAGCGGAGRGGGCTVGGVTLGAELTVTAASTWGRSLASTLALEATVSPGCCFSPCFFWGYACVLLLFPSVAILVGCSRNLMLIVFFAHA